MKPTQNRKLKKKQDSHKATYEAPKNHSIFTSILLILCFLAVLSGGAVFYSRYPNGIEPRKSDVIVEPATTSAVLSAKSQKELVTENITTKTDAPQITAKSYGIYYRKKNTPNEYVKIVEREPQQILPMASLTKLMTALVALEKYPLDKEITIPAVCTTIVDGSNVGLKAGEIFTLQDLLFGLLVKSGADAGCTIANIENQEQFMKEMNEKASSLGMKDTKFQNAIGFDSGTTHVSTINDLKILSEEVLKSNVLRKIISTQIIEISPENSANVYRFSTTNDLLKSIPGTVGIKTGFTELAKECLSYLYEDNHYEIMIILLGSEKRFEDTKSLLDWAKKEIENSQTPNP